MILCFVYLLVLWLFLKYIGVVCNLSVLQEHYSYSIAFFYSQIAVAGSRSKDYFDRHGDLKRIRRLKFRPMDSLLVDKYHYTETDARSLSNFLCPLLDFEPEKRPTASQCLVHQWITGS